MCKAYGQWHTLSSDKGPDLTKSLLSLRVCSTLQLQLPQAFSALKDSMSQYYGIQRKNAFKGKSQVICIYIKDSNYKYDS